MDNETAPAWASGGKVDEVAFCQDFLRTHPLINVDGAFFTTEGRVTDEGKLRKDIYDALSPFVTSGVPRKVENILAVLRMECRRDSLPSHQTVIHVANGTYSLAEGFLPSKTFCRHRLPVHYDPRLPNPELWLRFLEELLEPEDILTLQEFMGYCLIPTTAAQKMLIITGQGGEGKSRIGVVMKELLGENMNMGSIAKIESSPFARADLEHVLVLVDDDLKMEALPGTNYIKSIITAELPMDLERKGIQSYQGRLNVRFMAFGNGTLQSLHDRSWGFFRRQIILTAKPKRPGRVDDPFLGQQLKKERDSIFLWCLTGLTRLIENDFCFTLGAQARQNIADAMSDGNNLTDFMESKGYFRLEPEAFTTSRALYAAYRDWCQDNMLPVQGSRRFSAFLKQRAKEYAIAYDPAIPIGGGRKARGFRGIRVLVV